MVRTNFSIFKTLWWNTHSRYSNGEYFCARVNIYWIFWIFRLMNRGHFFISFYYRRTFLPTFNIRLASIRMPPKATKRFFVSVLSTWNALLGNEKKKNYRNAFERNRLNHELSSNQLLFVARIYRVQRRVDISADVSLYSRVAPTKRDRKNEKKKRKEKKTVLYFIDSV